MPSVDIPHKLYFRIGEVARVVGVKPYVLRYWESEFAVLRPEKTASGHRLYRRRDVEILLDIKRLLYDEKFTISGAKKRLRESNKEGDTPPPSTDSADQNPAAETDRQRDVLVSIRKDLLDLYKMLNADLF